MPGAPSKFSLRMKIAGRRAVAFSTALCRRKPPRFGVLATLVIGSSLAYGVAVGGHTIAVIDAVAQPLGFSINRIDVEGNRETSEIDVLQTLWATGSQSLLSLDPTAARAALEKLPWIERASVAKIFPDRVRITVLEHRPFALWQRDGSFTVVDREGREIMPFTPGRFSMLPVIVGEGAADTAAMLLDEMEATPELRARVKAYIRVGDRRWDLRLDDGVTIRLPEDGPVEALEEVARIDRESGLLSRDIEAVDMRLEDRMVVKLTPAAVERRETELEEREKALKRARKAKPV
ncbi:cell division protein FtsQ [Aurantimonas sp. Leaf443]|nr:cell division protein FtsQ [Aurantimonas sp. Leaf443]